MAGLTDTVDTRSEDPQLPEHSEGDVVPRGGKRSREDAGSTSCCLAADPETESCSKRRRKEQAVDIDATPGDFISRMTDLIQDKMFSFLDITDKRQVAQVCSSWKKAVYSPCHWKEVAVSLESNGLSEEALSGIKERKMRHVVVDALPEESKAVEILQNWSGLASLNLGRYVPVQFAVLQRVFREDFLSLKEFRLQVSFEESPMIPRFDEVFKHLPTLEHLSILSGHPESDFCLESLGQLGNLQSLSLTCMTLSGIGCLPSFKTLKKLHLTSCNLGCGRWPKLLSKMSSLEELELCDCSPRVEDGLRQMGQGLEKLKMFTCDDSCGWPLDDHDHLMACVQMYALQELTLKGFELEDGLVRALSYSLKNMRSLRIEEAHNFSVETMEVIAGMSSLQELSLASPGVDGRALKVLSEGSCQLKNLCLNGLEVLKGKEMKHLARMSSLQELTLEEVILGLTGIKYLSKGAFRLQGLRLIDCSVTLQGIRPLLAKQPSLQVLCTEGCVKTGEDELEVEIMRTVYPFLKNCTLE